MAKRNNIRRTTASDSSRGLAQYDSNGTHGDFIPTLTDLELQGRAMTDCPIEEQETRRKLKEANKYKR